MSGSSSWTLLEQQISDFRKTQCKDDETKRLHESVQSRLRDSTLGIFLYHLNRVQMQESEVQEDKLERVRFDIDKNSENLKKLQRRNDISENVLDLIHHLLEDNPSGTITTKSTLQKLKVLRLTGSQISIMDRSLQALTGLQALVLAGNCLSEVPGHLLPRSLLLLELSCNRLTDASPLLQDIPPDLLYLGLARNYLTNNTVQPLQSAGCLYHLDLAHNDVEDLTAVVSSCSLMPRLTSLVLVGNPCSMVASYMPYVVLKLQRLIYLDGLVLKTNEDSDGDKEDFTGTLQITLFRIMSLPQPENQKINKKKVLHSFRIEVDCPLLSSRVPIIEESFVEEALLEKEDISEKESKKLENSKTNKKNKKESVDRSRNSIFEDNKKEFSKKSNTAKSKKKGLLDKEKSEEDSEEAKLYETMIQEDKLDSRLLFVSEKKSWAKLMEFSSPTIEVPNCDLTALRNVFRSHVTIYVVHIKTLPPTMKKRKKSKTKNSKKGNGLSQAENASLDKHEDKELLISKTIVSKIKVPLEDTLWSTQSLDYSWSKRKPLKVELAPGLKALQYVVKKKKQQKSKKGKLENESTEELQIPVDFTVHLGIGLKRC